MQNITMVIARILLGHIFLLAGINKIGAIAGTQGYMEAMGVPGILIWPTIALEIVGGLAIILGWQTRLSSVALAGFTILSAVIFHNNLADQTQSIMFMKNLSIAGGLLVLAVYGAGQWSLDAKMHGKSVLASS